MHIGSVECAGRAVGDSETAANLGAKKVIKPPTFRRRLMNTLGALTVGVITGNLAGVLDPRDLTPVAADNPRPAGIMVDDSEYFSRMAESVVSPFAKSTLNRSEVDPKNYETRTLMNGRKLTKFMGDWSNEQLNMLYVGSGYSSNATFYTDVERALDTSIRLNIEPFPQVRSKYGYYAIPIEQLNVPCSYASGCSGPSPYEIINSVLSGGFLAIGTTIIYQDPVNRGVASVVPIGIPIDVYGSSFMSTGAIRSGLPVAAHEEIGHLRNGLMDEYESQDKRPQPTGYEFWNCINETVKDKYWGMLLGPTAPVGYAGCGPYAGSFYRDDQFDLMRGFSSIPHWGEVDKAVILRNAGLGVSRYQVPSWFRPVIPAPGERYFAYAPMAVK